MAFQHAFVTESFWSDGLTEKYSKTETHLSESQSEWRKCRKPTIHVAKDNFNGWKNWWNVCQHIQFVFGFGLVEQFVASFEKTVFSFCWSSSCLSGSFCCPWHRSTRGCPRIWKWRSTWWQRRCWWCWWCWWPLWQWWWWCQWQWWQWWWQFTQWLHLAGWAH